MATTDKKTGKTSISKDTVSSKKGTATKNMDATSIKRKKKKSASTGMSESTKRAIKVVVMMIIISMAIYMIVSSASYIFTWSSDQASITSYTNGNETLGIANNGGKTGAIIGSILIGKWFGIVGIMLPVSIIILSFLFTYRKIRLFIKVALSTISGLVIWSTAAAYFTPFLKGIYGTSFGGGYGAVISDFLDSQIGVAGTILALVLLIIIWTIYTFPKGMVFFGMIYDLIIKGIVALFSPSKKSKNAPILATSSGDATVKDDLNYEAEVNNVDEAIFGNRNEDGDYIINNDVFSYSDETLSVSDKEEEPLYIIGGDEIDSSDNFSNSMASTISHSSSDIPFEFQVATEDERERFGTHRDDFKESFEITVSDNVDFVSTDGDATVTRVENEMLDAEDIPQSVFDPTLELSKYKLPPVDLLDDRPTVVKITEAEIQENKESILNTLRNFNIEINNIRATVGPTVTLYEIVPAAGVRISKIKNLEDDIALSLSALGIRIIAPMPGKGTIGIEVPNKNKEVVSMYSVVTSAKFQDSDADLPVVLGRTIQNQNFVIDLAKMPHMLVAGATGQGKSVGLNAIITSLLYKKHPSELKFVMIDPKKVELSLYASLENHYLAKMEEEPEAIITDTQRVVFTLNSLCIEMDERYELLKAARMKSIKEYNEKFKSRRLNPNKGHRYLPYIVVIIDEFADLIMTAGKEIETPIARIAQLARAVGIHLVIATQRPTTNIITGVIKANFPARIAFRVISSIDSKTILDHTGANQLIGRGDMLVSANNEITRVQCAFIDTPEVEKIMEHIGNQTGFSSAHILPDYSPEQKDGSDGESLSKTLSKRDSLFEEIARYVVTNQQGSASTIQRNFSIGFNRAGRIMDQLEKAGIVGRQQGSKPRDVRISDLASLEVLLYDIDNSPF